MHGLIESITHFFIPRKSNNYRAKSLHLDFLTAYLAISLLLILVFKNGSFGLSNVLGFATDISTQKLYSLTNAERTKQNLPILSQNEKLSAAAARKAEHMFAHNYWAHFAPDGKSPWEFIMESGYRYEYAGENLAKNFLFSDGVVAAWMRSPSHRENILRPEYTDVGFAVVNGILNGEETTLVVQMFGKPQVQLAEGAPKEAVKSESIREMPIIEKKAVTVEREQKQTVNLLPTVFHLEIMFFIILLSALILDIYVASRMNIIRIHGKHMFHIVFISFVVFGLFIIARGSIQ